MGWNLNIKEILNTPSKKDYCSTEQFERWYNKYKSTVIFNESKESFTIILADGEEQEIREELNEILNV